MCHFYSLRFKNGGKHHKNAFSFENPVFPCNHICFFPSSLLTLLCHFKQASAVVSATELNTQPLIISIEKHEQKQNSAGLTSQLKQKNNMSASRSRKNQSEHLTLIALEGHCVNKLVLAFISHMILEFLKDESCLRPVCKFVFLVSCLTKQMFHPRSHANPSHF